MTLLRWSTLGRPGVRDAARNHGWAEAADDWAAVTEADDVDVVDVVTPNDSHAPGPSAPPAAART